MTWQHYKTRTISTMLFYYREVFLIDMILFRGHRNTQYTNDCLNTFLHAANYKLIASMSVVLYIIWKV